MKNKGLVLLLILAINTSIAHGQDCPEIDFGDYLNSNPSNCIHTIGNIPMQLFDLWNPQPYCNPPAEGDHIFTAQIQREDMPVSGKNVGISLVQGGCLNELIFEMHYENGEVLNAVGSSVVISSFDSLEYIKITEIECGLISIFNGQPSLPPVRIKFVELSSNSEPNPNACNDSDINYIETLLSNSGNSSRRDYHFYLIEENICNRSANDNCSVDEVFEFIKSNNIYQAPGILDYPSFIPNPDELPPFGPLWLLSTALTTVATASSGPYNVPVENCAEMQLTPSLGRFVAGIFFNIPTQHDCVTAIDVINEPIKIVVDDENRCITNYTLQGHFFYPGKVERCVISDDCGENVKVVTKGSGFSNCGDNDAGALFSWLNVKVGIPTFNSVNARLKQDFNN